MASSDQPLSGVTVGSGAEVPASSDAAPTWRLTLLWMFACGVGISVAMRNSAVSLAELWLESDAYGHGVFVIPIVGYAIWILRDDLRIAQPTWSLIGCLGMLVGLFGWVVGTVADIEVGHQLAYMTTLAGLVLAFTGWRVTLLLWFPIAFPFLAVPVWDVLVPPLQHYTAVVTAWAARALGVPVYVEGYFIAIPSGNFEIAEVCAGLRYLMAMASISVFYVFLNALTLWSGIAFGVLSLVWAIVFNWIRVTGIIMAGHLSEMQSELVHDHYTYGWILFAVALLPLFYVGRWFPSSLGSASAIERPGRTRVQPGIVVTVMVFISAVGVAWSTTGRDVQLAAVPQLPDQIGNWRVAGKSGWKPTFRGATWEQVRRYDVTKGQSVAVYVAVYGAEHQGEELINTQNSLYDRERWSAVTGTRSISIELRSQAARWNVDELKSLDGRRRSVISVFLIDGRLVRRPLLGKLAQVVAKISGQPAGALVAISTNGSQEEVEKLSNDPEFHRAVSVILEATQVALQK